MGVSAPLPGTILVEDIAAAVAWLGSDESCFVTGIQLPIDARVARQALSDQGVTEGVAAVTDIRVHVARQEPSRARGCSSPRCDHTARYQTPSPYGRRICRRLRFPRSRSSRPRSPS